MQCHGCDVKHVARAQMLTCWSQQRASVCHAGMCHTGGLGEGWRDDGEGKSQSREGQMRPGRGWEHHIPLPLPGLNSQHEATRGSNFAGTGPASPLVAAGSCLGIR